MCDQQLIQTIYKSLQYACFLNLSDDIPEIKEFLNARNWECIDLNPNTGELQGIFEKKYPTIFHYSWVGKEHTKEFVEYVKLATNKSGWQKRFILIGLEEIDEESEILLTSQYYVRIPTSDGNYFIHEFYKHYLNRK